MPIQGVTAQLSYARQRAGTFFRNVVPLHTLQSDQASSATPTTIVITLVGFVSAPSELHALQFPSIQR